MAQGSNSIAIGNGAKTEKPFSMAIRTRAEAKGNTSTAFGYEAQATGDYRVWL